MFGRPRCREWTPLATQQLRLRSLIQIVGYNIRPPEGCVSQCSFYLTLHHTTMSAPFYTSERISSPHPKWKEIDSELIHRMSSTNVVIRIWCHILHSTDDISLQDTIIETWGVYFSGLRYIGANLALNFTSDCFKSNTLVFQMQGGYFCSYKSLKLDIIPPENELEHGSLSSDSSGRTNLSRMTLEPKHIQNRFKEGRSMSPSTYARNVEKEYSKSNSPVDRCFKQHFPTLKNSASLNIGQSQKDSKWDNSNEKKNVVDTNYIYEHSPDSLDVTHEVNSALSNDSSQDDLICSKIDLSETAENYDLRNQADGVPKYRYLALSFLKSEIRPSYNATKLQKLHLLQYSIKKKQEAVQEIKERISQKSALTNEGWPQPEELDVRLRLKNRSQKNLFSSEDVDKTSASETELNVKNGRIKEDKPYVSNGPRLTLRLNDLLSYKSKPSPFQRAEHVRLTKQLEILRFKRIILSDERDSKLANIRRLKERRAKLFEENQDIGSELMENYHNLSRRSECIKEKRQACSALRELAARTHAALANLRCELLANLHEIFYIQHKHNKTWCIVDVPLPICEDDCPRHTNPADDAAAAGYAAQATCVAAALISQPLRYKVTLLGSATKILDVTPDLPDPCIPLFARGGDVTLFLYGMFLLNKCIAQLLRGRGLPIADMRTTLANIQRLLLTPNNLSDTSKLFGTHHWNADSCPRTQSLRSLVATDRVKYRQFNRFKDSVDGQSPQSALNLRRHRHSRSVGSYHDDQELSALDVSTTSIMGSEPNIYNAKLTQTKEADTSVSTLMKQHSSDSEITRLTEELNVQENKVIFTLGEDMESGDLEANKLLGLVIEAEKLVRISCNNGDELEVNVHVGDNVKRICSEIEDFCSSSGDKDVQDACDVVKHMDCINRDFVKCQDANSALVSCKSCLGDSDICGVNCANVVTDVIVIPSAEASLDIGQELVERGTSEL